MFSPFPNVFKEPKKTPKPNKLSARCFVRKPHVLLAGRAERVQRLPGSWAPSSARTNRRSVTRTGQSGTTSILLTSTHLDLYLLDLGFFLNY